MPGERGGFSAGGTGGRTIEVNSATSRGRPPAVRAT